MYNNTRGYDDGTAITAAALTSFSWLQPDKGQIQRHDARHKSRMDHANSGTQSFLIILATAWDCTTHDITGS